MKSLLLFVTSFLFFGLLTFSCGKVFAARSGTAYNGNCYAYAIQMSSCGTKTTNNSRVPVLNSGYILNTSGGVAPAVSSYGCYMQWHTYRWTGSTWTLSNNTSGVIHTADWESAFVPFYDEMEMSYPAFTSYATSQNPNQYWPSGPVYPAECTDELPVDCSEKDGEYVEFVKIDGTGTTPDDLCIDECEIERTGLGTSVRKPDCNSDGTSDDPCTLIVSLEYTGEECPEGATEAEPDDRGCAELQAECDELCEGGTNNTCTDPATFTCDCELPDYPVVQTGPGTYKPDQDEDLTPSDTDTDVDGDGTPNTTDDDVDGDGHPNGNDTDTDGDGTSNRGTKVWTNNDFSSGGYFDNHNGYGTDADLDGDGTPNATDPDIDGDGILNGSDPDMDGDGITNGGDVDADGDGILDGADDDPDNDGLTGADDTDPDGSDVGNADTNNDGVVDENDEPYTPEDEWPTEEEIESGYDGVGDNTYDSTIEGDFTDPDYQGAVQDIIDSNPLDTDLDGSEIQLTDIDSCVDFPNPYTGGTEQFCFNKYDTYWRAMGFLFIGMVGFMCFRLIAWRY